MVSLLALMVTTILLFWGSEQKIVYPAGKWIIKMLVDSLLIKNSAIANGVISQRIKNIKTNFNFKILVCYLAFLNST
jgi:hypothetical protein